MDIAPQAMQWRKASCIWLVAMPAVPPYPPAMAPTIGAAGTEIEVKNLFKLSAVDCYDERSITNAYQ